MGGGGDWKPTEGGVERGGETGGGGEGEGGRGPGSLRWGTQWCIAILVAHIVGLLNAINGFPSSNGLDLPPGGVCSKCLP